MRRPDQTLASMRIQRSPGESVEVDWAGDPMWFADPLSGTPTQAWVFVAALSFSAYTYVEAFTDMTLSSWIGATRSKVQGRGSSAGPRTPHRGVGADRPSRR
jgi:hypothetical protein